MTQITKKCYYCEHEFDSDELRPCGPNDALICFDCGMLPEYREATETNLRNRLEAFIKIGATEIIFTEDGPKVGGNPN